MPPQLSHFLCDSFLNPSFIHAPNFGLNILFVNQYFTFTTNRPTSINDQYFHAEVKKYCYSWVYEQDQQLSNLTTMHSENYLHAYMCVMKITIFKKKYFDIS